MYVHEKTPDWERLESLVDKATGRRNKLTRAEVDEFLVLYERTSLHLSHLRTNYRDPQLLARLTQLIADARAVLYGGQPRTSRALQNFFTTTFPAAVWSLRIPILISTAALLIPAIVTGIWVANSPDVVASIAPDSVRDTYINEEFEAYYSSSPAAQFSTEVLINNIQVAFQAFVAGIVLSVPTLLILGFNGANVGLSAGLFHDADQAAKFWGLILPHGLLELTAIAVAGGAGIALGWALIAPGDRSRSDAIVHEARRSVSVVLGLVVVFITAGFIEGFVTPSSLPTSARVSIGVAALLAFLTWVLAFGPDAVARGYRGAIDEAPEPPASEI